MKNKSLIFFLFPLIFFNCADTLVSADGISGQQGKTCNAPAATTTTIGGTPTVYETSVDATCDTTWTYFDLDTRTVLSVSNPTTDTTWEMAFQRYKVKINGGVSGSGSAVVVPKLATDYNFDSATNSPTTFTPQLSDQSDPTGDANDACRPPGVLYAFLNSTVSPSACWFLYDGSAHTINARTDIVFALKTNAPKYYKIKFLNYYSSTGTSGVVKFRWAEVAP